MQEDNQVHVDSSILKKEVERLKAENSKKDSVIQTIKKENMQLKAETNEQNAVVKGLQSEVRKLTMMMSNGRGEKKDNSDVDSTDEETPSKDRPVKRRLDVSGDEDFIQTPDKKTKTCLQHKWIYEVYGELSYSPEHQSVGEKFWAHYKPDDQAYPAKVNGIKGSTYRVKCIEDNVVVDVKLDELWRFTSKKPR